VVYSLHLLTHQVHPVVRLLEVGNACVCNRNMSDTSNVRHIRFKPGVQWIIIADMFLSL
jgi:hypothetical protein